MKGRVLGFLDERLLSVKRIFLVSVFAAVLAVAVGVSAFGLGLQNVYNYNKVLSHEIQADFLAGAKGSGAHGTDKTKVIKQCYVRLTQTNNSTGKVDFDSQRGYSSGKAKSGVYDKSPNLTRNKAVGKTISTFYGWIY
jgi:hypothetical protein